MGLEKSVSVSYGERRSSDYFNSIDVGMCAFLSYRGRLMMTRGEHAIKCFLLVASGSGCMAMKYKLCFGCRFYTCFTCFQRPHVVPVQLGAHRLDNMVDGNP